MANGYTLFKLILLTATNGFLPAEPSELAKLNAQAEKEADQATREDLAAADEEAENINNKVASDDATYKPAQETEAGKGLPEGVELEEDEEEELPSAEEEAS